MEERVSGKGITDMYRNDFQTQTNRGFQWVQFAEQVLMHVDHYTIPQYGDAPDDDVEEWTAEDCQKQIKKYVSRMNGNGRGNEDNLLSCLKIAHYACILRDKLIIENNKEGEGA